MSELFGESFDKELSDVTLELERIRELGQSVGNTLTRGLRGAITEGRSLQSLLGEIGRAFADIALKAALRPLGALVSGGIETLFSAVHPGLAGFATLPQNDIIGSALSYFPSQIMWRGGTEGSSAVNGSIYHEPPPTMPRFHAPHMQPGPAAAVDGGAAYRPSPDTAPMTVNFNVTASDARSFLAAEAEVNAMLLRAVRRGGRGS